MMSSTDSWAHASLMEDDKVAPIAIVGMGCRFPNDATTPEKFWSVLIRKHSARGGGLPNHFDTDGCYHPANNRTRNNRAGSIIEDDEAAFDAPFFSISTAEATNIDPMHRSLLEVVYEALENAGIPLHQLLGTETGCFVGSPTSDFNRDRQTKPNYSTADITKAVASNLISRYFDLRGPSMTLDAVCSSSLMAVHLACQSIRSGESGTAIVGANNAIFSLDTEVETGTAALVLKSLQKALRDGDTIRAVIRGTVVNSDGKTLDGIVPSKDAQMSLIESAHSQAGCDMSVTGDFENHITGKSAGEAVEAGALGAAMGRFESNNEEDRIHIGSVNSHIDHLGDINGLAGLIKAVLSVEKGIIAPDFQVESSRNTDLHVGHIRVPKQPVPWPVKGVRRASVNSLGHGGNNSHVIIDDAYHYLVSRGLRGKHRTVLPSLNFEIIDANEAGSGHLMTSINADALSCASSVVGSGLSIISTPNTTSRSTSLTRSIHSKRSVSAQGRSTALHLPKKKHPRIFYLSANEEDQVKRLAAVYAGHIAARDDPSENELLDDLAYTLCQRRSRLSWGISVVASTKNELVQKLKNATGAVRRSTIEPKLGFIFTGEGAKWWTMGRELSEHPVFEASLLACGKAIRKLGADWSIFVELLKSEETSSITNAVINQPLCTAVQIALVDMLAAWNIHPARVVGHSSGEIAAAYAAGALSLESAMRVAYWRGVLAEDVKHLTVPGAMLTVELSEDEAKDEIVKLSEANGRVCVACVDTRRNVTISGDASAITQLQQGLISRGIFAEKLQVDTAYHSHHMVTVAEDYRQCLEGLEVTLMAQHKSIEMFSAVTEQPVSDHDLDADYWVKNMTNNVHFSSALQNMCRDGSMDVLIELGPDSALAGSVKQIVAEMPNHISSSIEYLPILVTDKDSRDSTMEVAAKLFARGCEVDTIAAQCPTSGKSDLLVLTDLPSYCWNHDFIYRSESISSKNNILPKPLRSDILGTPCHDWNPIEPRWRNFIRPSEQPWVRGHKVQGTIVYPAAGFCCMAVEAAAQISSTSQDGRFSDLPTISEFKLREVSIAQALVVPDTDEGIEVIFILRSSPSSSTTSSDTWKEFRIFSCSSDKIWKEHCRGQVSVTFGRARDGIASSFDSNGLSPANRNTIATEVELDCAELYKSLDAAGLTYGPDLQGIVDGSVGPGEARGTVQVKYNLADIPQKLKSGRLIHPSTMDGILQMCIAALSNGDVKEMQRLYIPILIDEIIISQSILSRAGDKFEVIASARPHGFREALADVSATQNNDTKPVVQMRGVKYLAISPVASTDPPVHSVSKHCYAAVWEPDVDLVDKDSLSALMRQPDTNKINRLRDMELVAWYFIDNALKEVSESEVANMLPQHQKFFHYLQYQREMIQTNTHEQQTSEWSELEQPDTATRIQRLIQKYSDPTDFEGRLLTLMGQNLPAVLRGGVESLALMTKDNLLDDYYASSLGVQQTYPQVARYVQMLSHKNPNLRYLEIGAGTGGLTVPVLDALCGYGEQKYPRFKSYTYTDISSDFFENTKEKLKQCQRGGLINFKQLNIGEDPEGQGFASGTFDVILAANVLHATFDIHATIPNCRKLLRPGGKLVVLDMTRPLMSVSLVRGNLPGWWNCKEAWREHGPLLKEGEWEEVLVENGFSKLQASTPDSLDPLQEMTRVLVVSAVEAVDPKTAKAKRGRRQILILEPESPTQTISDVARDVQKFFIPSGMPTEVVNLTALANRDMTGTILISLAEYDDAFMVNIDRSSFETLQRAIRGSVGLLWVTRGGSLQTKRPEMSLFHGLARSIRAEHDGLPCITLDIGAGTALAPRSAAHLIYKVLHHVFKNKDEVFIDREYCEYGGVIHIKRAIEDEKLNLRIAARTKLLMPANEMQDIWQSERPLKLKMKNLGSLNSFIFDDDIVMNEPVPAGEVEVEVRAVGLNLRDVLVCIGELGDDFLGNECAGIVTQLGEGVEHLNIGDRVAVWCLGSFSTRVRNPACCVQRIPDDMPFSVAAALPVAHVIAYYALIHVAQLSAGETVLIHSAAGGVGQAAIQIAKMVGANIFATVGTDEEKEFVAETYSIEESQIFSSRNLTFAEGIIHATNGRGVDVVINDLAGEALHTSWRCVAPFGRFLEIGGKDINANGRLEMAPFARNVTFTSVDINFIHRQNLRLAGEIFTAVMAMVRNNHVREPTPLAIRPFSAIEECFRQMKDGNYLGKIVLEPRKGDMVSVVSQAQTLEPVKFPDNATYLLADGFGGLGRSVTRWMAAHGAMNFIFVSRSGTASMEAKELILELSSTGVRCSVVKCGVEDAKALSAGITKALRFMPPIRGVIQAAMVSKDQVFATMSHNDFMKTIQPKVQGSWALHEATLGHPLDFFVLLSSVTGFVGNAGQSSHASACTYQVALAAHRRSLGLPATAIDLGKVASVGSVAEQTGTISDQNPISIGVPDIEEDEFLAIMELAMASEEQGVKNGHLITGLHSGLSAPDDLDALGWRRSPIFSHLGHFRPHLMVAPDTMGEAAAVQQAPQTRLSAATTVHDATEGVLEVIIRKLSKVLRVPRTDINGDKTTSACGVDSLIAPEFRSWIQQEWKADMSIFNILQARSLTALASQIVAKSSLTRVDLRSS